MFVRRMVLMILATVAVVLGGHSVASATYLPPRSCATHGDLICETPRYRAAVKHLRARPALTLPGQWVSPNGRALVRECLASYPNTKADRGIPNAELMDCLTQPDPRTTDRRVITVHQAHVLHLLHVARSNR